MQDDLKPLVASASERYGVPEEHIWNVIRAEGSGPNAVSPKDARGIMQITPIALQDVTEAGLVPAGLDHKKLSLADQINTGTAYLSRLMKYSSDPKEIYAMYNFGPKARFQMDNLPDETKNYLEKAGASTGSSSSVKMGGGKIGTFGQGMMGSDQLVQMLMQSTGQQNAALAKGTEDFGAAQARSTVMATQALGEQQIAVEAAMANAGRKAAVDYTINKTTEGIQQLFNMNPEESNNEIAASLAAAQTAREARVGARAEYDQAVQISPLEDPLGWIMAQIKLPQLAARNNAFADQEDIALDNIDRKTRALSNAKATITANTADQMQQIQVEQASNDALKASAVLTAEQAKVVSHDAATKLQQLQIADKIGDNARQTVGTIATLQDRQDGLALREESRAALNEGKKLKAEEEAAWNKNLKTVSDFLGQPSPMTVAKIKNLPPKERDIWIRAGDTGVLGSDLESSLRFYIKQRNPNNTPASVNTTADKLAQAGMNMVASVEAQHNAQPGTPKLSLADAESLAFKTYKTTVEQSMGSAASKQDLGSTKWDKDYNPYVAQFVGFSAAIDTLPEYASLKTNPIKLAVDSLLKAGAVKGENLTSEQQKQAVGAVVQNVLTHKVELKNAAADIAAFFTASAEYNKKWNKYDLFGLPVQTSYMFSIPGGTLESGVKVNLMNPTAVGNAIMSVARKNYTLVDPSAPWYMQRVAKPEEKK